ncbi:MAG: hypothetical protein IKA87_08025 [Lentisphaeria bacterium]|nr:hypothetical protein [Lentisphaeria bacterium]
MIKKIFFLLFFSCILTLSANKIITSGHEKYARHLQGIAVDEKNIFWSFTDFLVKTDYNGKFIKHVPLPYHSGDICMVDGDIFVATDHRTKNGLKSNGNRKSAVLRFNKNLDLVKSYPIEPDNLKIEGITFFNGKFYIGVGGNPKPHRKNDILIFDRGFKLLKRLSVDIGCNTRYGVQNLFVNENLICGGFYGGKTAFCFDPETLKTVKTFPCHPREGIAKVPESIAGNNNTWFVGVLNGKQNNWRGMVRIYRVENDKKIPVKPNELKLVK